MKMQIISAAIFFTVASSANAISVSESCFVNSNEILVKMKGTSGDPFSQKGQIRLVRPGNSNIGLDPIIATSEPKTIYRFGQQVTFTSNDLWNPVIEYGDKLVIWTKTYNYHKIIHCDGL